MSVKKIALISADSSFVSHVKNMLFEVGYERVVTATSYTGAMDLIIHDAPDFLLTDTHLEGKRNGIDLAHWVNEKHPIPVIFISQHYSQEDMFKIKELQPAGYLVHPVSPLNLQILIELVEGKLANEVRSAITPQIEVLDQVAHKCVFIKEGNSFMRLDHELIQFVESHENYVKIFLQGKLPITVRYTMKEILDILPQGQFVRISRSHIVRVECIDKITQGNVYILGSALAIGKTYRDQVYTSLKIKEGGVAI